MQSACLWAGPGTPGRAPTPGSNGRSAVLLSGSLVVKRPVAGAAAHSYHVLGVSCCLLPDHGAVGHKPVQSELMRNIVSHFPDNVEIACKNA